ncbi:MAG TPA: histidine kinase dimerization/phospho-acceptor domain-containing protein, partial [Gaiellaceae bacterium]
MPKRPGHWLVALRAVLVVVAIVDASVTNFPSSYRPWAWAVVAFFALSTLLSAALARRQLDRVARQRARILAIALDTVVAIGFVAVLSYQPGEPYRALYLVPIAEAALRFGLIGGVVTGVVTVTATIVIDVLGPGVAWRTIASRILVGFLAGVVIGRLRDAIAARAAEAERLRDELGRRGEILEAANRCARALGSSLEIETAFGAFIRELRVVVPFDRTAIVLIEDDTAKTIATAGRGATEIFPPGSSGPVHGSVLDRVRGGDIIVRGDIAQAEYPEDKLFADLGLHSEIVAPLLVGSRPIGMIALSRAEVDAFSHDDVEMIALLGRLAATAVQNIRAYEAEHQTVEELRRLSALRADFVSLVSHELRSPMAAVIGAARTLQERWRSLSPEQREAFLALIADETNRLAILIGDVLN